MKLDIEIEIADVLKNATGKVVSRIEKDLQKAITLLGKGAIKKANSLASEKLDGGLESMYQENLYMEQISDNMVVIGIRPKVKFIEHGQRGGFMEYLLKNAKTSKDGTRYKVIPFRHNTSSKNKSVPNEGTSLANELKTFLKSKGQPFSKTRSLALDASGSPRIGRINSWDINSMKGKGKKSVKELSRNLKGVSVYQNFNKETNRVERNIMTFRVITDKHRGNKWMKKGDSGVKILEETHKWVQDSWEKDILPQLKQKYEGK